MAEALGLASSIIALVQLSASVYSAASKFYREAKDAKSKIGALATQARNLSGVLQSLSLLASSPLFEDAERKLDKADSDFESGSHRKLITRSLKWPFESQETKDLIDELSRHQDVLQLALSADTMSRLLQCLANTNSIAQSIDILNRKLERKESIDTRAELTTKRETIVQSFLKFNPEGHLQDCRSRREPNTGRWLIERDETFRNWISALGSQIWLHGIPGAGKTVLCGAVVDEILQEQTPTAAVAFFFCDYRHPETLNTVNILATLAVQLAKQSDDAFKVLESYHEELLPHHRIGKPPEVKRMVEVVQEMIDEYDRVYLAIDGLDECGTNVTEVLKSLKQLAERTSVSMALFSRNEPDIMDELSESQRIEISAHTEDLEIYVLAQMESRKRLGSLAVKNPELHEHIRRTLVEGANGMFRWVSCQLDHLDGLPSDGRRRKALTELPPTLFETYDRILDRIMQEDEHDQEVCRKALHWIGLGSRNFDFWALCEAISVPDDQDLVDKELLVDPDWVSRSCSSLIRLAEQTSLRPHFEFAHFTVKEYLRSIKPHSKRSLFRFSEGAAIKELLGSSLRFLTFPMFNRRPAIATSEMQRVNERNQQHPFYPVAAAYIFCSGSQYWLDYIGDELSVLLEDENMMRYAKKLFHPDKEGIFLAWVAHAIWYHPRAKPDFFDVLGLVLAPEFTPLHMAAILALPSICTYLIDSHHADVNACHRLGSPLHGLLAGPDLLGSVENFEYDPNRHFRVYPQSKVAGYSQARRCLEALLERGADTSLCLDNVSVFQMAIFGSTMILYEKLWVKPLINPSTVINEGSIQSFKSALAGGAIDSSILDAIFELGPTPDISSGWARLASLIQTRRLDWRHYEGGNFRRDLQCTISDEDFVDVLRNSLNHQLTNSLKVLVQDPRFRPDIYIPYDDGTGSMPVLHFAARSGNLESVQLLLDAGCDPRVVDENDEWTALHQSALGEHASDAAITALLLKSGAVDSAENELGETCWHVAAEKGTVPVLEVVLDMGGDTTQSLGTISSNGRTPLAVAILEQEVESALLLLDHCPAKLEVFRSDRSLLDMAATIGRKDLFVRLHEKLKEAGATEVISSAKPFDNIDTSCSGELLDYLQASWGLRTHRTSTGLINYLLDVNNDFFQHPSNYPSRHDMDHIIRELLPPNHVFLDDEKMQAHAWGVFCEKVVIWFTNGCDHKESRCRSGLIRTIFEILIDVGVLDSYERSANLPGYRVLFQALLNRDNHLSCSWIATSVHLVMQAKPPSDGFAAEAICNELLSYAVRASNTRLVNELLHHGVDVHEAHGTLSPLEQACFTPFRTIFQQVLKRSKRSLISRAGSRGMTLLHWLVYEQHPGALEKVKELLQLNSEVLDKVVDDKIGDTALTMASRRFHQVDVVQLLVSRGANPLHRARDGWTILHAAALTGDPRFIQSLVHSETPMSFWLGECEFRFLHVKSHPLDVEKTTATHIAARNGRSYFLKYLIRKKLLFNVNTVTGYPFLTPLHLASCCGQLEAVEILLSCSAKVNVRDSRGLLPIDYAAKAGHDRIFRELLRSGSERPSGALGDLVTDLIWKTTQSADSTGDSHAVSQFQFENAIMHGDLDLCRKLVEKGQSINSELLSRSVTPLVCALIKRQTRVVDWLISAGVEVTDPIIEPLHPSLRCITSLSVYKISSTRTLTSIMSLALKQGMSWYGCILGPLHVAILDDNIDALEAILSHIRNNENEYRRLIETELINLPTDTKVWRGRSSLSILVNEFNREEAFSNNPLWDEMPSGSPLHWAIREDNLDAVRLLLQNEGDVNQVDSSGQGPLKLAVLEKCDEEIVKALLDAGANSMDRLDAMMKANSQGDLEAVKNFAEADSGIIRAADGFETGGLLNEAGSVEVFQYLYSQGLRYSNFSIDISAIAFKLNTDEFTGFILNSGLLSQATEKQISVAVIDSLHEDDCSVLKRLHHAVSKDLFVALINRAMYGGPSALCAAAAWNKGKKVEDLIVMGAKIDLEGCPYGSPLMAACALGCLDVVRRLVRSGAALCYVNEDGLPRSAVSLSSRHHKVLTWLLVGRHVEQQRIEHQPSQSTPCQTVWSGPRLFKLSLPGYMHRDFGESRWGHLQRLQRWREDLAGSTLAESRKNSGLDLDAGQELESRQIGAQAAHRQFLARLGEA